MHVHHLSWGQSYYTQPQGKYPFIAMTAKDTQNIEAHFKQDCRKHDINYWFEINALTVLNDI